MDRILDFLNQPITLTLITLVVGSYLLSIVAERRSRRDRLKDKSVEFLTEAADNLNAFVPLVYRKLRTGSLEVDQAIEEGITTLFASRLRIQVGSQAYLKSDEFAQKYFLLMEELLNVMQLMFAFERDEDEAEVLQRVQARRQFLLDEWPLEEEAHPPSSGSPIDELLWLMDLIQHRTAHLLTSYLEDVVG